jgi:hypothetical protein
MTTSPVASVGQTLTAAAAIAQTQVVDQVINLKPFWGSTQYFVTNHTGGA